MEISTQRNGSTNDPTQIKNGPENANEFAFLILSGIRKHERSLCSPKQASTKAKNSPGRDDKTPGVLMDVHNAGYNYYLCLDEAALGDHCLQV
jgi:hypothetical protein